MKVRYLGDSFGVDGLTDGKVYDCLAIEGVFLRIVDDSDEDYLYSAESPSSMDEPGKTGVWEIVEDSQLNELEKIIKPQSLAMS